MKKRVTSYDVAQKAGVSQATVSYVLNGSSRQSISPDTRARVVAAAKELNYFPNSAAQFLRQENTGYICVVTNKTLGHPRYAETVQALRSELELNGYNILLASEKEEPEQIFPNYIRDYLSRKVDGIVYIGADGKPLDPNVLETVRKNNIPFLAYDCKVNDPDISTVDLDYTTGIRSAADRLLQQGCKRLLYLCPQRNTPQERSRKKAFQEICGIFSIPSGQFAVDMHPITEMETNKGHGSWLSGMGDGEKPLWYEELKEQLLSLPGNTGIICAWRAMLDYTVRILSEAGKEKPLAVLADERIWYGYKEPIFISGLPNKEAGVLCAQGIIAVIKKPEKAFKRSINTLDAKRLW